MQAVICWIATVVVTVTHYECAAATVEANSAREVFELLHKADAPPVMVVERGPAPEPGLLQTLSLWEDEYPPALYTFVYWQHPDPLPATIGLLSTACSSASEVDACFVLHTPHPPPSACCMGAHSAAPEHWELIPDLIEDHDLPIFSELTEAIAPLVAIKPFTVALLHLDPEKRWCHHSAEKAVARALDERGTASRAGEA